jgi:hypothetical protein
LRRLVGSGRCHIVNQIADHRFDILCGARIFENVL